jgi:hypothetical protein
MDETFVLSEKTVFTKSEFSTLDIPYNLSVSLKSSGYTYMTQI